MHSNQNPKEDHPVSSLIQNREYVLYLTARFCITIGMQILGTIVAWQVYALTNDTLALGLVGLSEALPYLLTVLYSGHIADSMNRRTLMRISTLGFGICAVLLLYLSSSYELLHSFGVYSIYTIIVISGLFRSIGAPAFSAFLAQLVDRIQLAQATTWNSNTWQFGAIIGPALGGLVYSFTEKHTPGNGAFVAYIIVVIMISIGLACIQFIGDKPTAIFNAEEPLSERLSAGLKFVFSKQILVAAFSLDLFAVLFGGAVAVLPAFAKDILQAGPETLGLLRSSPSIGALIMGILVAKFTLHDNSGKKLLACVALFGLCMIGFALSTNIVLSIIILGISGAVDQVSVVIRQTIMQLATPNEMRGRVSAVSGMFITSSNEIGAFESGLAAKLLGLVPSVVLGGIATLSVVGITYFSAPKLRKLHIRSMAEQEV